MPLPLSSHTPSSRRQTFKIERAHTSIIDPSLNKHWIEACDSAYYRRMGDSIMLLVLDTFIYAALYTLLISNNCMVIDFFPLRNVQRDPMLLTRYLHAWT